MSWFLLSGDDHFLFIFIPGRWTHSTIRSAPQTSSPGGYFGLICVTFYSNVCLSPCLDFSLIYTSAKSICFLFNAKTSCKRFHFLLHDVFIIFNYAILFLYCHTLPHMPAHKQKADHLHHDRRSPGSRIGNKEEIQRPMLWEKYKNPKDSRSYCTNNR